MKKQHMKETQELLRHQLDLNVNNKEYKKIKTQEGKIFTATLTDW